jgi:hypothetical protein
MDWYLLVFILSTIILVTSSKSERSKDLKFNANYTEDAMNWCKYIKESDEPKVLLYNRVRKCGSSTMQYLYRQLAKENKFLTFTLERMFWTDLDASENSHIRDKAVHLINEQRRENHRSTGNPRIVVDGHFWQTEFEYDTFHHKYEYTQLIRDCHGRRKSAFYYLLYDSVAAYRAKKSNNSTAYHKHILRTDDPVHCLQHEKCLRNTGNELFSTNIPIELRHICGSKCNKGYEEPNKSLLRVLEPSKLTVLGLLENMTAYLEMLECAYPSFLHNISDKYKDINEVSNGAL